MRNIKEWTIDNINTIEKFIKKSNFNKASSIFSLGLVNVYYSKYCTTSSGGMYKIDEIWVPGIKISLQPIINNPFNFCEYEEYSKDLIIGSFSSPNIENKILATVCHEMSHAMQKWSEFYLHMPKSEAHGPYFRQIYSMLRKEFVNKNLF